MEARAKHSFVPSDPSSELAFRKGDLLKITNYGDQGVEWYNAEMGALRGLVPGNYIDIEIPSWYVGRISRTTAEAMLSGNRVEGAFLVRLSESSPQDFSLSVKCGNAVQHFRILKDSNDNKYFLWTTRFNSLNELVDHYRNESVSRTGKIFLRDMCSLEQFIVEAIYDFKPSEAQEGEQELEFQRGDLITVLDNSDENWWNGSIGERNGYFPKSYVRDYKPAFQVNDIDS